MIIITKYEHTNVFDIPPNVQVVGYYVLELGSDVVLMYRGLPRKETTTLAAVTVLRRTLLWALNIQPFPTFNWQNRQPRSLQQLSIYDLIFMCLHLLHIPVNAHHTTFQVVCSWLHQV